MMFRFFQQELQALSRLDQQGRLDLYFSDEASFHFNPQSMYGWQPPGQSYHLPSQRGNLLNILGFVKRDLTNTFYEYEQAMNAEMFELLLEDFIQKHKKDKPLVIVLDRAAFHYNERIRTRMKEWRNRQIYLQFLPAYSPELNIIEVVWKHCKHRWLSFKDWISPEQFKKKGRQILQNLGKEFHINFQIVF